MVISDYVDGFLLKSIYMGARWAFRIWIPSSAFIVLGRFSKEEEEVKESSCLPIKRRLGGGCSVVLYPGTIVISVALRKTSKKDIFPREWISFINDAVISALRKAGLRDVEERGWGDIAYGDRKIGGVSLYSSKDLILYQLSLIYSLDLELISGSLKHPPREPDYRKGRDHVEFLTSIKEADPCISLNGLIFLIENSLKNALASIF
ncbi:MAG: hypothetical protein N3C62_05570 [Synergistetes bacterium]|nr:hypothetical protein [Synergistota bacterium]MCX8128184.1 hypothetical protein [Synergistota bacterium]MDW8192560.1 hypothetical protein [Synergistota bacterium]